MRAILCAGLALFVSAAPGRAQQDDRWQVTLNPHGNIIWELRLVRLKGDMLVVRQGDSTFSLPLSRVDELRLVHKSERRHNADARGYGGVLGGADDEVYRLTLFDLSERRRMLEQVFKDHPAPASTGPRTPLWQIVLKDGTIVWNLHLVKLERDTLVFRRDGATVSYPLMRVDVLRMVRGGEHEIGPVAAGGRYEGAANGASDVVYQLTLLDLAERRGVIEQILKAEATTP